MHVAVIWQRFLPYHVARLRRLNERLAAEGHRLTAIEVAAQDLAYGFPEESPAGRDDFTRLCCFPGTAYHGLTAEAVGGRVLEVLCEVRPDIVFAPATPFPEGMAAILYRTRHGKRVVMMDDAWEHTDRRGLVVKVVKRLISRNIDGAFVPAPTHRDYFVDLGIPVERIVYGVDVVDNDYFANASERTRARPDELREAMRLPERYFLFVGRLLPRKGLRTLLGAYARYRETAERNGWDLVLVGGGEGEGTADHNAPGVLVAGPQFGEDLCRYYGLATALIVPSDSDPWALVVNEGMAAGLPVIVSRGCGAARTLVREGENGWTFEPGDEAELAALMARATALSGGALKGMGEASKAMIAQWSLDRFSDGALAALRFERRPPSGLLSKISLSLWKGRIRVT